jgi:LPS-assembly lipoprotein
MLLVIIMGALTLNGCGFQLNGYQEVPEFYQLMHVQTPNVDSEIDNLLKDQLRSDQVQIVDNHQQAPITLAVLSTQWQRYNTGSSSSNQARVYQVKLHTEYQLQDRQGHPITETKSLTLQQKLILKKGQLISNNEQYQHLQQQMRQDMVSRLITSLRSKDTLDKVKNRLNAYDHS